MKKALILSALAATALTSVSPLANATAACSGGTGANFAFTTTANMFVKTAFTVKCSANVYSNYTEIAASMGVVAGSARGKNYFGGGTLGGGVTVQGTCATSGCTTTEISNTNSATMSTTS